MSLHGTVFEVICENFRVYSFVFGMFYSLRQALMRRVKMRRVLGKQFYLNCQAFLCVDILADTKTVLFLMILIMCLYDTN